MHINITKHTKILTSPTRLIFIMDDDDSSLIIGRSNSGVAIILGISVLRGELFWPSTLNADAIVVLCITRSIIAPKRRSGGE